MIYGPYSTSWRHGEIFARRAAVRRARASFGLLALALASAYYAGALPFQ